MPQFEIYQRQEKPSDKGVQSQMSMEGVSALQKAGEKAVQTVDYIAKAWEEADYLAQSTTAKNNYQAQMMQFNADLESMDIQVGEDGDYYKVFNQKQSDYKNKLDAIRSNTSTITNERAKKDFSNYAELNYIQAKIKMEAAFRNKQIEHQKVEVVRNGDVLRKSFVAYGNDNLKQEYYNQIQANYQAGFLDEAEKLKFEESIKSWDNQRILKVAEIDPKEAFKMLEEKDLEPDDKASLLRDIRGIQTSKEIEAEVMLAERYSANREQLTQNIVDPGLSYNEKKDLLDEAYMYDDIDKDSYQRLSNALTSRNAVDAKTNIKTKSDLLVSIKTFSSEFPVDYIKESKDNAREYYRRKAEIEDRIIDEYNNGTLSTNDYKEMLEEISVKNSMPAKEGTMAMSVKKEANYADTFNKISKQITGETARANAINEYYTEAKQLMLNPESKDSYKDIMNRIIRKYKFMPEETAKEISAEDKAKIVKALKDKGYAGTDEEVAKVVAKVGR